MRKHTARYSKTVNIQHRRLYNTRLEQRPLRVIPRKMPQIRLRERTGQKPLIREEFMKALFFRTVMKWH